MNHALPVLPYELPALSAKLHQTTTWPPVPRTAPNGRRRAVVLLSLNASDTSPLPALHCGAQDFDELFQQLTTESSDRALRLYERLVAATLAKYRCGRLLYDVRTLLQYGSAVALVRVVNPRHMFCLVAGLVDANAAAKSLRAPSPWGQTDASSAI
jgi:hypothetical protein